ncbi:nuclease-related domain-containing protein [Gracilibacillus lacisalsi]|uniref:nuclease-related domain-containing protein n=1 Tax=Gracilibacillus lacisalsi TaxID=393087 RepID=UPI000362DD0E|nr:nuclease-related domain-containing protein [Gracilibacillus lacisalsi]
MKLSSYQALLERLNPRHPQYADIHSQFRKYQSGLFGEDSLDYYFRVSGLHGKQLIKGLRLKHHDYFQMDRILVSLKYILIIEVKNMSGIIHFDSHSHQLHRYKEEQIDIFPDPILQVQLQKIQLMQYLHHFPHPIPPIHTVCVFTNSNGKLEIVNYPHKDRILTSQALPLYIQKMDQHYVNSISSNQQEDLVNYLKSGHVEDQINLMEKHGLSWNDLKKGVPCITCGRFAMKRERYRWQCPHCDKRSDDAHLRPLFHLALLSGNKVTNRLARDFLLVQSADAIRKMLVRAGFERRGANKNGYYSLDFRKVTDKQLKVTDKDRKVTDKCTNIS